MHKSLLSLCTCLLFLAMGPSMALPSLVMPATQPAQRLAEILVRINAGDRDSLVAYALQAFTPGMLKPDVDSIVDFLMAQYEAIGGYDVRRVIQSSDEQISALVQGRRVTDRWVRFVVGAESAAPHRVQGVFLYPASAALAEDDGGSIPAAELPERFTRLVDRLAAEGDFSGSVCLSREGKTLLNQAWGEADREAHVANRPDTRFSIASLGKMFTAVLIAQLVERGVLHYEDRVVEHIPQWLAPASHAITVEQLLTHTSGLGDYLATAKANPSTVYDLIEDYRVIALAERPAFEPGTQFRYSNTGYLLLGALIEAVSGEPWDRYLARHVLGPAKMTATSGYRPRPGTGAIAAGYVRDDAGRWSRNDSLLVGRGTPAGGSVSTAQDLVAFANALRSGALVSPASLVRITTPQVAMEGTGMMYGLGFTVARGELGRRVYGHAGGFPGVGALLEVYEEGGFVLAVLANTTTGAQEVGDAWRDLLRRREPR